MTSNFLGRAGEYTVAAQLLARGIVVHFPAVDTGVDLIAGSNIRIQVKSRRREACRVAGYSFTLGTKRETHANRLVRSRAKNMADWFPNVDFLVCWGVEENRFWIIPRAILAKYPGVQSLLLGSAHRNIVDQERLRSLLASGMRQCDIAREMGLHPVSVSEHVRGRQHTDRKKFYRQLALEADKYENAWHEIEAALKLTEQIDAPIEMSAEIPTQGD